MNTLTASVDAMLDVIVLPAETVTVWLATASSTL